MDGFGAFGDAPLGKAVGTSPDIVSVVGSRNDATFDAAQLSQAVFETLAAQRQALPSVEIFVAGPIIPVEDTSSENLRARDAVAYNARLLGVFFLDPIQQGWLTKSVFGQIAEDGVHPTDEGYAVIASKQIQALECRP